MNEQHTAGRLTLHTPRTVTRHLSFVRTTPTENQRKRRAACGAFTFEYNSSWKRLKCTHAGTIGTRPVLDRRSGGTGPAPLWRTSIRVRSYPTREAPRRPSYTIPSRARTGRVFVAALTRARHLNNITRRVARRTTSNTCAHGGDPHDLTASGCQRSELPGKLLPA